MSIEILAIISGYRMRPYLVQSVGETNSQGNKVSILHNTEPQVQMRIPCYQK